MQYSPVTPQVLEFEQLASTNDKAKELLKEQEVSEGTIIKAIHQFAGRGYASNTWESAPGKNVTASWILKPDFMAPHHQFRLTQMLSLALKNTVDHWLGSGFVTTIKWPNDIYLDNRKIAGILVENSIMTDKIKHAVCGIGLNVNQEIFVSDAPNPVSMHQATGKEFPVDEIISTLSEKISYWYNCLRTEKNTFVLDAYHNALFRRNTKAKFFAGEDRFEGIITGTDSWGRLIIETARGETRLFDFKEVGFIL